MFFVRNYDLLKNILYCLLAEANVDSCYNKAQRYAAVEIVREFSSPR